ncbi:MAG: phospholipase D-like domain-containing protein [Tissierellia bacterium]|nr:phospholipase D-like domain-containing protein [Tissierellia bacterium]
MRYRIKNSLPGTMTTIVVYLLLFILQFGLIYYLMTIVSEATRYARIAFLFLDFAVAMHIINDHTNDSTYKIAYLFVMIIFPVFGSFLYLFSKWDLIRRSVSDRIHTSMAVSEPLYHQDPEVLKEVLEDDPLIHNTLRFLWDTEGYPSYPLQGWRYYPLGEEYIDDLIEELKKAKNFIFMEYFIIQQGKCWDRIMDVLVDKVRSGVEVRVLLDGTALVTKVPFTFARELKKLGIEAAIFKPIVPVVSLYQNHRDHRKIAVIDNRVAFTGGVNLADEYANEVELFGHWKDTGVKVTGPSVNSFTNMFLTMWHVANGRERDRECIYYTPFDEEDFQTYSGGTITPFGDDPYGAHRIGKEIICDMINQSTEYLHITTPYLILDEETKGDLIHLAESGAEVIIVTPHIPDKRVVFLVTRSYYKDLLRSGVRIFEYSPGFIHAKNFISDGRKTLLGTINCDYRSLFLHFECGAYIYDEALTGEVEGDFQKILSQSEEITLERTLSFSRTQRALGRILRIFAPMM